MLIICVECGLQVSNKAISCPHCGFPIKPDAVTKKSRPQTNKRRRLPNGFGQISEIKGRNLRKPFRAMVPAGKTEMGRPISKLLQPEAYFSTYNEAYTALMEYNKNPYDLGRTLTVKELYEKWSEGYLEKISNKSSICAVKRAWKHCSAVYDMLAVDVRVRHIKGCMEKGLFPDTNEPPDARTKGLIKTIFNQMFDYALEYELIEKNYSRSFKLSEDLIKEITAVKDGHIPFTNEEISILWENLTTVKNVDILLIQCYSGWRPQELCLLKISNIDLDSNMFIGGMKTDAGINRAVPIHSKIRPLILERYKRALQLKSNYLFNVEDQYGKIKKFQYHLYREVFNKIRDELNLNEKHHPHDGRTHFVTTAKKCNVDEYAIKYIVGHKITDITEKHYTKRNLDWLKSEIEKIE